MSPNSLWRISLELTTSISILPLGSKIIEFMSLSIANFMASNSPKASASAGGEEASLKFDKHETSCSTESRKHMLQPIMELLLKKAQSRLHFRVANGGFVHDYVACDGRSSFLALCINNHSLSDSSARLTMKDGG